MKRFALVSVLVLLVLGVVIGVSGKTVSTENRVEISGQATPVSMDEAKKIALKKVEGKITEEYSIEEEDGKVSGYLFIIQAKNGKNMEVQIDAQTGNVVSAEEIIE